jgi:hypothetical protein
MKTAGGEEGEGEGEAEDGEAESDDSVQPREAVAIVGA